MPNEFNANDIFEIAKQIEKNGAAFYKDAADRVEEENLRQFLLELAAMEENHEKTFEAIQKKLESKDNFSGNFDPEEENPLYLKALADTRVFFQKEKPDKDLRSILKSAIRAEKDSIAFYTGMKDLIPEKHGRAKVDEIIREEMSHIRIISEKLLKYCRPI